MINYSDFELGITKLKVIFSDLRKIEMYEVWRDQT